MEYQALYRQFRPELFDDMVGQESIVKALTNQVLSGRVSHAYLFCGTRGTGKTTTARILSRAVNCEHPKGANPCNECESCKSIIDQSAIDVVEIDAASNTGVDSIREIKDEISYPPVMLKYKVYIIDEVHMLSTGAFNALLKTLEEPPEHVIFILATTEYQKVPATILSRCQRFDFKRIDSDKIFNQIKNICEKIGCKIEDEACSIITYAADGSMRDGLAILDKCVSYGNNEINSETVTKILGIVNDTTLFEIADGIATSDISSVIEKCEETIRDGRDPNLLSLYLIEHFRSLLVAALSKNAESVLQINSEKANKYLSQSKLFSIGQMIDIVKKLSDSYKTQKESPNSKVMLEIGLVSICGISNQNTNVSTIHQKSNSVPVTVVEQPPLPVEPPETVDDIQKSVVSVQEGSVAQIWDELLNELKRNGKRMLASNLSFAEPHENGDKLDFVFKKNQEVNKNMVDNIENLRYIIKLLKEISGKEFSVRLVVKDESKTDGDSSANPMDLASKFPDIVTIEGEN